ncbi:MAG: YceI family protein [Luteimonas sp.]
MTHPVVLVWLLTAVLAATTTTVAATPSKRIDPSVSQIGFTLTTRWGQTLQGRFPHYQGEVADAGDGRHEVRLRLSTRDVEIIGHPSYSRLTRGSGFFDAKHFPQVEFISDAYPPALLRSGGAMTGTLSIRGIRRHEVFVVSPATCEQPARDCDVVATGTIDRSNYGMGRWDFALSSEVRFNLRVRVRGEDGA